ncbi:MurR/RpiR family transcriptional regulator [Lactococcus garvieae]|jgi:DNA-binding MurR/RpiR family transcriptional regulator|uniref:MurR/RpiR family transcriptional regulator n=1 Tax=Lactococcus garvieae TaxID=1363 RepID=UPI0009BFC87E|nr:MurR/RpiR family transcriptional regulator [Lactococcus garvieae]QPS71659.1 MurR/RpiR family transcriptional regulator [Lactococcus garvieae]
MNILLEIQMKMKDLSPNEAKVGKYVLQCPEEAISLSTQDIAKKSQVSPATVIRFVKSIGLEGVPQLKQQLSVWKANAQSETDFQELRPNEDIDSIKSKLKARINHMTELVNGHLNNDRVEKTVQLIDDAELIFIFGIGASFLVAQDLAQKLNRIGKISIAADNTHTMGVSLTNNNQKKLFIAISDRGESREVLEMLSLAQSQKIETVAITGIENSSLAQQADYPLISLSGENFEFRHAATVSMLAQLYLIDLLFYAYVSQNFESSREAVIRSLDIVRHLEKNYK